MSETTPIDLPVGLRWVKLVCRLGRLVTDSAYDADPYPDLLPVRGALTLTASPSRVRIQEADGRWRSVEVAGREYNIRADGELVDDQGRVGVWIPDPTSLLVEPQGYAVTAAVKPTGGTGWSVTIGGSAVLPDVVDLVAVSPVGPVSPNATASFDARIYSLEQGGGVDVSQAVEDYLTANPPSAAPDATTAAKGLIRLAGDLGGTADAPTVPGLADKADTDHGHAIGDVTGLQTALDGKQPAGSYAPANHSHVVADITATGTPSATTYLRGDGAWATPEGGGGESQGPSHVSIMASGNVTLPTEHPVLTIRADDPATLSIPEAPDGTVVTIHVAHGWENLTWAPGITVTGNSATTETWVVLVRKEGAWSALVSGPGGGGMTGHGRPDGKSWANGEPKWTQGAPLIAPLGTTYTDLDMTDGAVQWMVTYLDYISWYDPETGTYHEIEDGPVWTVMYGYTEWWGGLTPPAGYDSIDIDASRRGDWVDVQISIKPSGIGQGVPVTVPAVESYHLRPPTNFAPSDDGLHPIEVKGDPDFVAAVSEPPQVLLRGVSHLSIPSFEIGAFTADEFSSMGRMLVKAEYRIKGSLPWPIQMEEG